MANLIQECLDLSKEIDELNTKINSDLAQANSHERYARDLKIQMGKETAKARKIKASVTLSKLSLKSLQSNKEELMESISQQETVTIASLESARLVILVNAEFKKPFRVRIASTVSREVADEIGVVLTEAGLDIVNRVHRDTSQATNRVSDTSTGK